MCGRQQLIWNVSQLPNTGRRVIGYTCYMWICVYVYKRMHVKARKSTLDGIPHVPPTLFYETVSLTGLEITK